LAQPLPISSAAREQIKTMRDIVISSLRVYRVRLGLLQRDSGDCRIVAGIRWGSFCIYNADCESRRTRLEPLLSASGSIRRKQFGLIQLRQGLIEASDACVVEVSRLMEPHDDRTGVVLPRCSRWVLCRTRKRIGGGEHRDGGNGDDFDRTRRPPAESTGRIKPLYWSPIEQAGRKHPMISFSVALSGRSQQARRPIEAKDEKTGG
jgi:hypothetical protein